MAKLVTCPGCGGSVGAKSIKDGRCLNCRLLEPPADIKAEPAFPPENASRFEVLPGVLIAVSLAAEFHEDGEFPDLVWPPLAACSPVVGDFILALDGKTAGEVVRRVHGLIELGPILHCFVKVDE